MILKTQPVKNCPIETKIIPHPRESLLFFDIETTGFSPKSSFLYLAGAIYYAKDGWYASQWLAENTSEEKEVLTAFFAFCQTRSVLVHFNGEGFDLPYLEQKALQHGIPFPLSDLESLDLYRSIRPLRSILKLEHLNQKALESFLGIHRRDCCTGGELISVYHQYIRHPNSEQKELLLLHNLDDLKGMLTLPCLLSYPALFNGCFTLQNADWEDAKFSHPCLILELALVHPLPQPISFRTEYCYLRADASICRLRIYAFEGTLKYYFSDYRNYYYVPDEDRAIHKSVASYIHPSKRVQAKAATAYQNRTSLFLPQRTPLFSPVFRENPKSNHLWFECTEAFMNTPDQLYEYVKSLISIN